MACHVTKINIIKQPNKHCTIKQESKGFWDYWRLTVQLCPSPINSDLHMHTYNPCVLLHVTSLWTFLSKSHRNSAIHKNLNLFVASCFKWFFGGNFKLSYHFWALLPVTILSIRHTYELLLFCYGKASNIQCK